MYTRVPSVGWVRVRGAVCPWHRVLLAVPVCLCTSVCAHLGLHRACMHVSHVSACVSVPAVPVGAQLGLCGVCTCVSRVCVSTCCACVLMAHAEQGCPCPCAGCVHVCWCVWRCWVAPVPSSPSPGAPWRLAVPGGPLPLSSAGPWCVSGVPGGLPVQPPPQTLPRPDSQAWLREAGPQPSPRCSRAPPAPLRAAGTGGPAPGLACHPTRWLRFPRAAAAPPQRPVIN